MHQHMSRYILIFFWLIMASPSIAQVDTDSMMAKLEEYKFRNWDSLGYYAQKIIESSTESDLRIRGVAYQNLGVVQFQDYSNYDSAMACYDLAKPYLEELGDSSLLSLLFNSYGVVYKYRAEYELALQHFFQAIDYSTEDATLNFNVTILNNIGEVSFNMGKVKQAEEYHKKAYTQAMTESDSLLIGNTHLYLGNMASSRGEFTKAIEHYEQCLAYLQNFEVSKSVISMNLGIVYHFQGKFRKAIEYYAAGIDEGKKYGDLAQIALCYLNYGEALVDLHDAKAIEQLTHSIELAKDLKMKRIIAIAQQLLSRFYEQTGQYDLALDHFKLHKLYLDSVLNESTQNRLSELEVKFQTSIKEKQISEQQLQIEQKNASINRQKNQTYFIIGVALLLITIGGFNYWNYRNKQKIKLQQALIQEKEKGLIAVLQATEEEKHRISKELHDGVGQQLSGLKMKLESLNEDMQDQPIRSKSKEITEGLQKTSDELRTISHQMMPRALIEEGLVLAVRDLVEQTFHNTPIKGSFEYQSSSNRFESNVELNIFRSIQEILNNSIKHSEAKNVSIQFYQIKNKLILTIEDDGKGFDPKLQSNGHGIQNIKSRISLLNGNVNFESVEGSGTVITLSIPLKNG